MKIKTAIILIGFLQIISLPSLADVYNLEIKRELVNKTGKEVSKITVNGDIPGPTLHFKEGEEVTVNVTNHMKEPTSIHWHGFLLPGNMDGVPGLNGFKGIAPGTTFTYHFKVRQNGTYWYHSHSNSQEQDGNYGSIIVTPKDQDQIKFDRDYIILLSDFSEESSEAILSNLKMDSGYYNYAKRTIFDFFHDVKKDGFSEALEDRKHWGEMRMDPTDLSDVTGYKFLVNGKTIDQNWTGIFKAGERIRLRFINASSMSIYDLRIPGLKMTVMAADGQNIDPVTVDEFRFGVAETYDVIVTPENKAYTIVAEPIDRTGFALATLAPKFGMKGEMPKHRKRAILNMTDMGMAMDGEESAWTDADTPPNHKALNYSDLHYFGTQKDLRKPSREIAINFGGNMQRYIWTINGKKFEEAEPIILKYGERVRLKLNNETMMAHPIHLHGMFVQLENGQPLKKLPNKHTVILPPGKMLSVLLTANEQGEWALHCHLLYHMLSGMMSSVIVASHGSEVKPYIQAVSEEHHHGH